MRHWQQIPLHLSRSNPPISKNIPWKPAYSRACRRCKWLCKCYSSASNRWWSANRTILEWIRLDNKNTSPANEVTKKTTLQPIKLQWEYRSNQSVDCEDSIPTNQLTMDVRPWNISIGLVNAPSFKQDYKGEALKKGASNFIFYWRLWDRSASSISHFLPMAETGVGGWSYLARQNCGS